MPCSAESACLSPEVPNLLSADGTVCCSRQGGPAREQGHGPKRGNPEPRQAGAGDFLHISPQALAVLKLQAFQLGWLLVLF